MSALGTSEVLEQTSPKRYSKSITPHNGQLAAFFIMHTSPVSTRTSWNKGKLIGQKLYLKLHEIWAMRIRLQLAEKIRDLALFNLAIDSKLRGCDLVKLKVSDISHGSLILKRAMITQQKNQTACCGGLN
jgi:hypothetical protein